MCVAESLILKRHDFIIKIQMKPNEILEGISLLTPRSRRPCTHWSSTHLSWTASKREKVQRSHNIVVRYWNFMESVTCWKLTYIPNFFLEWPPSPNHPYSGKLCINESRVIQLDPEGLQSTLMPDQGCTLSWPRSILSDETDDQTNCPHTNCCTRMSSWSVKVKGHMSHAQGGSNAVSPVSFSCQLLRRTISMSI